MIWKKKKSKLLILLESLISIKLLEKCQMVNLIFIIVEVLSKLIKKISVGSKIIDLCVLGDNSILEELSKVFNKKQVFKGIAFPTCISVNEICGYNSPYPEDSTTIKEGDLVKI